MVFSVFQSTVHKSLYRPADDSFRAAVMYGVTRILARRCICLKKSEEIFTTLVNRQDTYCPMQNFTRNLMVFSVFPSTVHKSLYRLADDSFRAAVMYGVRRIS